MGQSAAHLTPWILTGTAGTFLYVALADMVRGQPGRGAAGPGHVPAPLSPRSAPSSPRCCGVLARAPGATSSCRTRGSCWAAASCWASPWPRATSVPGYSPDRGGGLAPLAPTPPTGEARPSWWDPETHPRDWTFSPPHETDGGVPQPGSLQSQNAWKLTWGGLQARCCRPPAPRTHREEMGGLSPAPQPLLGTGVPSAGQPRSAWPPAVGPRPSAFPHPELPGPARTGGRKTGAGE